MNFKQGFVVSGVSAALTLIVTLYATNYLVASDPSGPKPKKEMYIQFAVNSADDELEVTAQSKKKCKDDDGQKSGCFRVGGKKYGLVKYEFREEDVDEGWELKKFIICQRSMEISHANPCTTDLTVFERLDFFVMQKDEDDDNGGIILTTPESGVIDISILPAGAALKEFYVFDQNIIKRDYVYSIEACKGEGEDKVCILLDPPVENKGRN